jgi:hypothetical protein
MQRRASAHPLGLLADRDHGAPAFAAIQAPVLPVT